MEKQTLLTVLGIALLVICTSFIVSRNHPASPTATRNHTVNYTLAKSGGVDTAAQLRARYDSVVWIAHENPKTFYYVVKGNWDQRKDLLRQKDQVNEAYGMGMVNSGLKEVIPPKYDLVYQINGTFPGLVEVEKDGKKGFFDLDGKNIIPVAFDQVLPIDDDHKLAILRKGQDYFYLQKGFLISGKTTIKIGDYLSKIKDLNTPLDVDKKATEVVTEYNSASNYCAVYIAPSYMAELGILPKITDFASPLKKVLVFGPARNYEVEKPEKKEDYWLIAVFYSITDHFLGGRGDLYTREQKNLVLVDKKSNLLLSHPIGAGYSHGRMSKMRAEPSLCAVNGIKQLPNGLIEVKTADRLWVNLYDSTKAVFGGPAFHYMTIKNNQLTELPNNRNFGFTKYVKMDDTYLNDCYDILINPFVSFRLRSQTVIQSVTPEMLLYMKNEIFADYRFKFADKRWQKIFEPEVRKGELPKPYNTNVDDSLTVIDKYNINFINQKLKGIKTPAKTLAAQ